MSDATFPYAVFLRHCAQDQAVVRPRAVAASRPSAANSTADQTCHGKEDGGALPSRRYAWANAFSSDGAQLLTTSQPTTLNPQPACALLNQERRFIPLRLDDAPSKASWCNSCT